MLHKKIQLTEYTNDDLNRIQLNDTRIMIHKRIQLIEYYNDDHYLEQTNKQANNKPPCGKRLGESRIGV